MLVPLRVDAVTIRHATVEDLERIVQMAIRFLQSSDYGEIVGRFKLENLRGATRACIEVGVILLAEHGPPELRRAIGFCALVPAEHVLTGETYADEIALWVEPEHRTGTVGGRLVLAAEHWARQKQLTCLKMVAPVNSRLHLHYQRRGYRAVETGYLLRLD